MAITPIEETGSVCIEVLDALPGSGKTEAFVDTAVAALTSPTFPYVLIYAAPTVALLNQVSERIRLKLEKHSLSPRGGRVVERIISEGRLSKSERHNSVRSRVNNALGITLNSRTHGDRLSPGSILLITHEAFMMISRTYTGYIGEEENALQNCWVFFDEARRLVAKPRSVTIPTKDIAFILPNLFRPEEIENVEHTRLMKRLLKKGVIQRKQLEQFYRLTEERIEGLPNKFLYEVNNCPTRAELEAAYTFQNNRDKTITSVNPGMKELFETVHAHNQRGSVFLYFDSLIPSKLVFGKVKKVHQTSMDIFTLVEPRYLFHDFGRVTIMSAFFRDSQMFQLLKKAEYRMKFWMEVPPTDSPVIAGAVANIRRRHLLLGASLKKRLSAAVLLHSASTPTLTRYMLDYKVLLPDKLATKLEKATAKCELPPSRILEELFLLRKLPTIQRALQEMNPALASSIAPIATELRRYMLPPIYTLYLESQRYFAEWRERNAKVLKRPGLSSDSLVLLNQDNGSRTHHPSGIRDQVSMVRDASTIGEHRPGISGTGDGQGQVDSMWNGEHKRLTARTIFGQDLIDQLQLYQRTTVCPMQTDTQGLNNFSSFVLFAHLAALNPTPDHVEVLKILMPHYDIASDHVIDNLVQGLYRTNLRDPNSTTPIFMVVPFQDTVDILSRKLESEVQVVDYLEPRFRDIHFRNQSHYERGVQQRASVNRRKYQTPEDLKKASSITAMLFQARKHLKEAQRVGNLNLIAHHLQRIKDLFKERDALSVKNKG